MRILIDAANTKPTLAGIATYSVELAAALTEFADVYVVTSCPDRFPRILSDRLLRAPKVSQNFAARQLWREYAMPGLITRTQADVVIVNCPEMPLRRLPVPAVMVLHDISAITHPSYYSRLRNWRFRLLLPSAISRASAVVAISNWTATSARAWLKERSLPVEVIGCGISPVWLEIGKAERCPGDSDQPYIAYVGTSYDHKNLKTLVAAMRDLPNVKLRLAGPGTEAFAGAAANVEALGWLPFDELATLVTSAALLVNPSLVEGFGLPALEALAVGTPVLLSDIPAFREVAAEAADFVSPPDDPGAWSRAIKSLLDDTQRRGRLEALGPMRAQDWTWESAARQMLRLVQSLQETERSGQR